VGHAPEVRALEKTYFGICALGAPLVLGSAALGGYFSGRHRTGLLMTAQVSGLALNALLDWLLIFGKAGFPALGMAGAAWATVIAHALVFATLAGLFLGPRARRELNTWRRRGLDGELLARLLRFGLPQGARYTIEAVAWTLFVMVVGRIGTVELASTNIAWRINGIAFFPVIGLSQAVAILVGNAQGARRPDLAARAMWRGILLTQIWMVSGAVLFVVFPRELYGLFRGADGMGADGFARVAVLGVVLLRYVAAYCLLDGMNVLLVGALQAAGDTHWTMVVSLLLHALFTALVLAGDALGASLNDQWLLATVFVLIQALVWLARFHEGRWRDMRVIESEDPVTP
jgi:MATE family multidrug resistance protein